MESTYITIEYNNHKLNIIKFLSESHYQFNQRLEYIKKLEKHNVDCNEIENLSLLWHCLKFKKCKYNIELENKVLYYDK
jgi:hypothetical protein